jgi:hypothetical protein
MPKKVKTEEDLLEMLGKATVINIGNALRVRRGGRGIIDRSSEKTTKERIEAAIDEFMSDNEELLNKISELSETECRTLSKLAKEMSKEYEAKLESKKFLGDFHEEDSF